MSLLETFFSKCSQFDIQKSQKNFRFLLYLARWLNDKVEIWILPLEISQTAYLWTIHK